MPRALPERPRHDEQRGHQLHRGVVCFRDNLPLVSHVGVQCLSCDARGCLSCLNATVLAHGVCRAGAFCTQTGGVTCVQCDGVTTPVNTTDCVASGDCTRYIDGDHGLPFHLKSGTFSAVVATSRFALFLRRLGGFSDVACPQSFCCVVVFVSQFLETIKLTPDFNQLNEIP